MLNIEQHYISLNIKKNSPMPSTNISTPPSQLKKYINDFLEYCEIGKNQSQNTLSAYLRYLKKFEHFAQSIKIKHPENITLETVNKYRLYLNRLTDENGKTLKLITQNYHLIALRAFLKYLTKQDIKTLAPEKIELPKNPQRQVEFLEKDELKRLFTAVSQEKDEVIRLRDYAILQTLFSTGLRVSELASLKKEMVNLERREFTVRGKGSKLRLVFLSDSASEAIKKYLNKRTDNNKALFIAHSKIGNPPSSSPPKIGGVRSSSPKVGGIHSASPPMVGGVRGGIEKEIDSMGAKIRNSKLEIKNSTSGLTPRSVQRIIKKYCLIAGIVKKVSPHTLRHSFATDLLQNGADIRSVQTLLGHASITTTQIYTHITNQGLRDIHRKYHGKTNNQ